ncbi:MAG TPA: hypothetical protein VFE05_19470 [Longimicrobiaceae bacterium]|jgi:hypothetical protein|nr:hypothetical protein [Longimicrobiaceae bacterium]
MKKLARTLALALVAAACSPSPDKQRSEDAAPQGHAPAPDTSHGGLPGTVSAATWTELKPGAAGHGLRLAPDGTLSTAAGAFAPKLQLADATGAPIAYRVSPPSPGARYAFVNGTARDGAAYLYVADLRGRKLTPTQVLKYGPAPWVAYAAEKPYALLVSKQEGTVQLFGIDLATGASHPADFARLRSGPKTAAVDESTLVWEDGDTFVVNATVACNASLEDCRKDDGKAATHKLRVEVPGLTWTEAA